MFFDGEGIEEAEVFGKNSDEALDAQRLFQDIAAGEMHFAGIGSEEAGEDFEQGGFAGAVGSEEGADAAGEIEGDFVEGGEFAEVFGDGVAAEHVNADYRRSVCGGMSTNAFARA